MRLDIGERPHVELLRDMFPEWHWRGRIAPGGRWVYTGELGDRRVFIFLAYSRYFDDSDATWYARENGSHAQKYWQWVAGEL